MKEKKIKKIIKEYFGKLNLYMGLLISEFSIEEIHRFRVEFKKTRAFLRMVAESTGDQYSIGISKKIKNYYQICGDIRNLQLQREMLMGAAGNHTPKAYLFEINKKIVELKASLSSVYDASAIVAQAKKTDRNTPEKLPVKSIRVYLHNKWSFIRSLVHLDKITDTEIHSVRKQLKDLVYNLKLLGYHTKDSGKTNLQIVRLESLEQLLHQLGDYQDLTVQTELMRKSLLPGLPASELRLLEQIRTDHKRLKKEQKKALLQELHHFTRQV